MLNRTYIFLLFVEYCVVDVLRVRSDCVVDWFFARAVLKLHFRLELKHKALFPSIVHQ